MGFQTKDGKKLNPILEKGIDNLVESKKKELKRMKLAAKMRKLCEKAGDSYVFILFDADTKPVAGDSMQVYDMKATWRKAKDVVINSNRLK